LLMGQNHIVILGMAAIREHREFVSAIEECLPRGLCLYRTQAEFKLCSDKEAKCFITPASPNGDLGYLLAFVPEGFESRGVLAILTAQYVGLDALHTLINKRVRGPIVGLAGPEEFTKKLEQGYATVLEALRMVHGGRASDITAN